MYRPDSIRRFEVLAIVGTGLGKFIFMDWLDLRFMYISVACLFWMGYIVYRVRREKGIAAYWGLTLDNFRQTFFELLPVAAVLSVAFVGFGHYLNTSVLDWTILPILLLYPIWGIIQQFLIIGLLARNLKDYKNGKLNTSLVVFIVATVFGCVHFPYLLLVLATFLLALVYTYLYLHGRNLIVFGIYHGWLGALFFYTVLGRHIWGEVFGI